MIQPKNRRIVAKQLHTDISGKMEVPDIVQMEKESNQDKKGPLPWNDYLGDLRMRNEDTSRRQEEEPSNTTTAE